MAHLLTGLRLLLVVPAALAFARWFTAPRWLLITLVSVAIATDYFDGVVARRRRTTSDRGQIFDHTTDFLFVTAGLTGSAVGGLVPTALPVLVVVAFTQYALDSHFFYHEKRLHMSRLGRWNGVLYFAPLVMIGLARVRFLGPVADLSAFIVEPFSYLLIASTVLSIVDRGVAPLRAVNKPGRPRDN